MSPFHSLSSSTTYILSPTTAPATPLSSLNEHINLTRSIATKEQAATLIESHANRAEAIIWTLGIIGILHDLKDGFLARAFLNGVAVRKFNQTDFVAGRVVAIPAFSIISDLA